MAKAVIGGRTYQVAPFRLRELRQAAPFIDRIAARAALGPLAGVQGVADTALDMLNVVAAGIEGASAAELEAQASLPELQALRSAFEDVLREAGLAPWETHGLGEAPGLGEAHPAEAPVSRNQPAETPVPPAASPGSSTTSWPSSSPPDAGTGTG